MQLRSVHLTPQYGRTTSRYGYSRHMLHLTTRQASGEDKTGNVLESLSQSLPSGLRKEFNPDDFSLATAIALGCCSFEAYNAPYKYIGLKETSPCGTETVFMDRQFLERNISGVLEVHLRRAIGLPQVEIDGKARPPSARCRVTIFPSSGTSEDWSSCADPHWRQTLYLYVKDPAHQHLELSIEHVTDDEEVKDVGIGSASLDDLTSVCDGEVHDIELKLDGAAETESTVQLSVRYQEHSNGNDVITDIKQQAVCQMMTDDWLFTDPEEWDPPVDYDWRCSALLTDERPAAADEESPIDIKGMELTEGQPLDRQPWKNWSKLRDAVIGRELFTGLTPLAFVVNKQADSEVWIYRSSSQRQIVISFRGTSSPKDMLTDAALDLAAFNPGDKFKSRAPEEVAEEMSEEEIEEGPMGGLYKSLKTIEKLPGAHLINQVIKKKARKTGGRSAPAGLSGWAKAQMMMLYAIEHDEMWCHKGFLQAYTAVRDVIFRIVDDIAQSTEARESGPSQPGEERPLMDVVGDKTQEMAGALRGDDRWHVYTTGHSMGGAMATLCAHELAVRDAGLFSRAPRVTMYSFGQPRVGNGPFARQYDEDVPDSWRIKNVDDMVTRVPSLLGYQHIGCEVNLFPHGKISISEGSTDEVREGAVLTDMVPKIKGGLTEDDENLKEEFRQLVKGEIDVFKAILQGEGINQHMEDVYHEYLEYCSKDGPEFCQPIIAALEDAKRDAAEHQAKKKQGK